MPMIPKRIHKVVEWHLRNANCIRANAFAEAEQLRARAREQPTPPEVPIKGKGKTGDPVGRAAQLMAEADKIQREAPVWAQVVEETRAHYTQSATLGEFYRLYFAIGLDFPYIAQEMGVEKTTLYHWREQVVTHAAMLAIEKGLVRMSGNTD